MQERGMQLENSVKMQAGNDAENRLVFSPQARPKTPGLSPPKNEKDLIKQLQQALENAYTPKLSPGETIQLAQKNIKKKKKKVMLIMKRLPGERLQFEWKNAPKLKPAGY